MNKFKKILKKTNLILTWFLLILIVLAIYGRVQMMFTKNNYVTFFGLTMFQVASDSMHPEMGVNDVILVRITKDIKVDDVISFNHEDAIVTHRVIAINESQITVKGDANNAIDAPIDIDDVIGRVENVFPRLRIWQQIFTDPRILVLLFVTLILFDFAFSYKGKKVNKVEENKKIIKEEPKEEVIEVKKIEINKDAIIDKELLALTQKIDLEELNALLAKSKPGKNKKEDMHVNLNELIEIAKGIDKKELKKMTTEELTNYTIRLDLKEIHEQAAKRAERG